MRFCFWLNERLRANLFSSMSAFLTSRTLVEKLMTYLAMYFVFLDFFKFFFQNILIVVISVSFSIC